MNGFLPVLMCSIHILSAIALLGGAICWRFVLDAEGVIAAKWRNLAYASIAGLLLSGIYNFTYKLGLGPLPKSYHSIFGIKMLLALHVFAVGILLARENNTRRARQLTGVVASGVVIVVLSATLRYITLK